MDNNKAIGMICITWITSFALYLGVNGVACITGIMAVAGLLGYDMYNKLKKGEEKWVS